MCLPGFWKNLRFRRRGVKTDPENERNPIRDGAEPRTTVRQDDDAEPDPVHNDQKEPTSQNNSSPSPAALGLHIPTSIKDLWDVAYEKLREDDESLIVEFQKRVQEDMGAAIGSTMFMVPARRRDMMASILDRKMKEIDHKAWKISDDVLVKDLARPLLGIVNRANEYITGALSSNPSASLAWAGVSLLLPVSQVANIHDAAAKVTDGLS